MMSQNIILNKCCYFELSIYQRILKNNNNKKKMYYSFYKILGSKTIRNIDKKKSLIFFDHQISISEWFLKNVSKFTLAITRINYTRKNINIQNIKLHLIYIYIYFFFMYTCIYLFFFSPNVIYSHDDKAKFWGSHDLVMIMILLTFHCWLYTLCIIVYVTNKSWTCHDPSEIILIKSLILNFFILFVFI